MAKSMTFDDLERPKRHSCRKRNSFMEPTIKISTKMDPYYQRQNVGLWR